MKRTGISRGTTPLRRTRIRSKRATARRREAPRWDWEDWATANEILDRRSGLRCECCGHELHMNVERHHRQKRTVGGDRLANLMLLKPSCHQYWTAHPAEAIARGIIVPTHADPASVPVLWRGHEWSTLDDLGARSPLGLDADWRIVS